MFTPTCFNNSVILREFKKFVPHLVTRVLKRKAVKIIIP